MFSLLQRLQSNTGLGTAITCLGTIVAAYIVYGILDFILLYSWPSNITRYHHNKDGKEPWAMVTGASAGIGKILSRELAARGFNVVLHGRNEAKLRGVQKSLEASFPSRSFRVLVIDAGDMPCRTCMSSSSSTSPAAVLDRALESLKGLHLTVIINNAGGSPVNPVYGNLESFNHDTILSIMSLNAIFPTLVLNRLLPQLARSGPSLVINIGSMSDNGLPFLSFYGPSKAYLVGFTSTIARESLIDGRDVSIMCVRVGAATGVSNRTAPPSLFEPDAAVMARAVLARVGCGRMVVVGYFWHALQDVFVRWSPGWLLEKSFRDVMVARREEERQAMKRF
jgi:17beta-estradiol 17-dehydrogenase / very-long-chain 3-oxoacyl-CoA reductase